MKWILVMLALAMLVACAMQKPKKFIGANGHEFYRLECKQTMDGCNAQASEICPQGYHTVHTFSLPMTYSMIGVTHKKEIFYVEIECQK